MMCVVIHKTPYGHDEKGPTELGSQMSFKVSPRPTKLSYLRYLLHPCDRVDKMLKFE